VKPGKRRWDIFKRLCIETQTRGSRVTDAWFAALAIEGRCEWITFDRDYARFPKLKWRGPNGSYRVAMPATLILSSISRGNLRLDRGAGAVCLQPNDGQLRLTQGCNVDLFPAVYGAHVFHNRCHIIRMKGKVADLHRLRLVNCGLEHLINTERSLAFAGCHVLKRILRGPLDHVRKFVSDTFGQYVPLQFAGR
jgi:hypothetical protein